MKTKFSKSDILRLNVVTILAITSDIRYNVGVEE
jgi:hypothetical protein